MIIQIVAPEVNKHLLSLGKVLLFFLSFFVACDAFAQDSHVVNAKIKEQLSKILAETVKIHQADTSAKQLPSNSIKVDERDIKFYSSVIKEQSNQDLVKSLLPMFTDSEKVIPTSVLINGAIKPHLYKVLAKIKDAEDKYLFMPDHLIVNNVTNISFWGVQGTDYTSVIDELGKEGLSEGDKEATKESFKQMGALFSSRDIELLKKLSVEPKLEKVSLRKIITELKVDYSPVWILSHDEKYYLFEGDFDPSEMISMIKEPNDSGEQKKSINDLFAKRFRREGVPFISNTKEDRLLKYADHFVLVDKIRSQIPVPPFKQSFKNLKQCSKPEIRRTKVSSLSISPIFQSPIDIIAYSDQDAATEQRIAASGLKTAIVKYPSKGGKLDESVPSQTHIMLINSLDVRCLPTRFHYISENSLVFQELREGDAIWSK